MCEQASTRVLPFSPVTDSKSPPGRGPNDFVKKRHCHKIPKHHNTILNPPLNSVIVSDKRVRVTNHVLDVVGAVWVALDHAALICTKSFTHVSEILRGVGR